MSLQGTVRLEGAILDRAPDGVAYAERLAERLANPSYRVGVRRRLWLSLGAIVTSLIWAVVSLVLLRASDPATPAEAFWFLCLLLAAGLHCAGQFSLVGGVISHMALQRFVLGQKDLDVFEATREHHVYHDSVGALLELMPLDGPRNERELVLWQQTLEFIHSASSFEDAELTEEVVAHLMAEWRKRGADENVLDRLAAVQRAA